MVDPGVEWWMDVLRLLFWSGGMEWSLYFLEWSERSQLQHFGRLPKPAHVSINATTRLPWRNRSCCEAEAHNILLTSSLFSAASSLVKTSGPWRPVARSRKSLRKKLFLLQTRINYDVVSASAISQHKLSETAPEGDEIHNLRGAIEEVAIEEGDRSPSPPELDKNRDYWWTAHLASNFFYTNMRRSLV